jgi:hypothetical protein
LGKITPERILEIQEAYRKTLSYKGTADFLRKKGIKVDERTVKRHATSEEKTPEGSKNRKKGLGGTSEALQLSKDELSTSKAMKMFYDGKKPIEVSIKLGLPPDRVSKLHKGYLDLQGRGVLNDLYSRVGNQIYQFEKKVNIDAEINVQAQSLNDLRSAYRTEYENYAKLGEQSKTIRLANEEMTKRNSHLKTENGELEKTKKELQVQIEFYRNDGDLRKATDKLNQWLEDKLRNQCRETFEFVATSILEEITKNSDFANYLKKYLNTPSELRNLTFMETILKAIVSDLVLKITTKHRQESLKYFESLTSRS